MNNIIATLHKRKYEAYLLSLCILIFGQIFLPKGFEVIWQHLLIIQNVLIGLLLFRGSRKWLIGIVLLLSAIMISECVLLYWIDNTTIRFSMGAIFSIYFVLASAKVYSDVLNAKKIGNEILAAVFSGLIMLGLIGSFIFTLIELTHPDSFSNLGQGEVRFQNLTYFSFVSLLTIGYGDIVPITQMAKKTSVLLGLVGNFYLTFVIAIVIGKYLIRQNEKGQ